MNYEQLKQLAKIIKLGDYNDEVYITIKLSDKSYNFLLEDLNKNFLKPPMTAMSVPECGKKLEKVDVVLMGVNFTFIKQ